MYLNFKFRDSIGKLLFILRKQNAIEWCNNIKILPLKNRNENQNRVKELIFNVEIIILFFFRPVLVLFLVTIEIIFFHFHLILIHWRIHLALTSSCRSASATFHHHEPAGVAVATISVFLDRDPRHLQDGPYLCRPRLWDLGTTAQRQVAGVRAPRSHKESRDADSPTGKVWGRFHHATVVVVTLIHPFHAALTDWASRTRSHTTARHYDLP